MQYAYTAFICLSKSSLVWRSNIQTSVYLSHFEYISFSGFSTVQTVIIILLIYKVYEPRFDLYYRLAAENIGQYSLNLAS